ncbi:glycosyltransferase, partial [bacterium]|nr:glycosyltransferase [bacterium]
HTTRWPSNSPSFQFVTLNALGLVEAGFNVYLFVENNTPHGVEQVIEHKFGLIPPKELHVFKINPMRLFRSHKHFLNKSYAYIKILSRTVDFDAVVTRANGFLPYLPEIKDELKTLVFFESHDFYADLSKRFDIINKKRFRAREMIEQQYIPQLDGVFCVQSSQMKFYREQFPNQKCFLVHTGLWKAPEAPLAEKDEKLLAYIGSLDKHKGVMNVLEVLAKLNDPEVHLLIIGGKTRGEIRKVYKTAKKLNIKDQVSVTGWIPYREISRHLRKVRFGVVPLENTFFNQFLTSPLKIFDFFANGIPVIANDLDSVSEFVTNREQGYIVKTSDTDSWVDTIKYAFSQKEEYPAMRKGVIKKAETLTWEQRGRLIGNIIHKYKEG